MSRYVSALFTLALLTPSANAQIVVVGRPQGPVNVSGGGLTGAPGLAESYSALGLMTQIAQGTVNQLNYFGQELTNLLPPEDAYLDQSAEAKGKRAALRLATTSDLMRGKFADAAPKNLSTKDAIPIIVQAAADHLASMDAFKAEIRVSASNTPVTIGNGPINIGSTGGLNLGLNFGSAAGESSSNEEEQREKQCKDAMNQLRKYIKDEVDAGTKVFLIGEEHETVTHLYKDILNEVDSTTRSSCFMPEFSQAGSYSSEYMQMMNDAKSSGWNVIRMDQAVGYYDRDPAGSQFANDSDKNSYSTYGMNTRDALMANVIRANSSRCDKIVTMNGAYHIFKEQDPDVDQASRVSLPEQLKDMKTTKIDLASMKDVCGKDTSRGRYDNNKPQEVGSSGYGLNSEVPTQNAASYAALDAQINKAYEQSFGRSPSPTELQNWNYNIYSGTYLGNIESAVQDVLRTAPYGVRESVIRTAYEQGFGRTPSADEYNVWNNSILYQNADYKTIANAIQSYRQQLAAEAIVPAINYLLGE